MKPRQKRALVLVQLVVPIVLAAVFVTESVHAKPGDVAQLQAQVASKVECVTWTKCEIPLSGL
jgi:N-acetylglutamate synthase/N-acetylornithine aminotransferase